MIASARLLAHRLRRCTSGVAMVEFAMSLPFLLAAGLYAVETANLAVVNMRIAQMAAHIADNASRVGDTSMLEDRKVYESDINDLLVGAGLQAGAALDVYAHGRVIISSLQIDEDTGYQTIAWQRCRGAKLLGSIYGEEGAGLDGSLDGMGPPGQLVTAVEGEAVIYVEVAYDYQPLVSDIFASGDEIRSEASFMVRDDRDLTGLYQRDPGSPDPVSDC